ncbi:MAG: glycosyltransferase family 2 protein [Symploca sp. SIO1C4]|uniref:Glycosyltransferase family 2 protein n=1 Tax=Symploca sp. SIO1C4 TaxID=2607765 RepID=A0A6B3NMW8_9CYAN|nr:glycosyltransferase family 2 protein [Symploca sp. SIO1C4]
MVEITVAICTYNGTSRLPKVLELLRSQSLTEHFTWEIIVIDNNSTDHTAAVVKEYQSNWSEAYPIKYYFEPKQGLAFARRKAIQEAKGSLIGFLDDDNYPASNWVSAAYKFGQLHPQAGAYGSRIYGEYEVEPPVNFDKIACFLAIIDRGDQPIRYEHRPGLLPAGAGLVIRKQAWLDHVPQLPVLTGVCTTALSSKGEDLETLSYIRNAGLEIWYNPEMSIHHGIPKSRLEKKYLVKLFRGVGLSRYPIRMLRFKAWQKPFILPVYMVNDLRKLIIYFIRNRQILKSDLVATCEIELLVHSIFSPFYHWSKSLQKFSNLLTEALLKLRFSTKSPQDPKLDPLD